jgi:hypothetical protein
MLTLSMFIYYQQKRCLHLLNHALLKHCCLINGNVYIKLVCTGLLVIPKLIQV